MIVLCWKQAHDDLIWLCGTLKMGRFGLTSFLLGMRCYGTARETCAEKEVMPVKQFKELNACIADLGAVLAGNDVRPEQRKDVEAAIEQLKNLRRTPDVRRDKIHRCVREVVERLIRAFLK